MRRGKHKSSGSGAERNCKHEETARFHGHENLPGLALRFEVRQEPRTPALGGAATPRGLRVVATRTRDASTSSGRRRYGGAAGDRAIGTCGNSGLVVDRA